MSHEKTESRKHHRTLIAAGAVGSIALALSATGTLSAFTASITNSANTATAPTLGMTETQYTDDTFTTTTGTPCVSNADGSSTTCSSINKYSGVVGTQSPSTTYIRIANSGTNTATTFTLSPGACTLLAQPAGGTKTADDVCGKLKVSIKDVVSGKDYTAGATAFSLAGMAPITLNQPIAPGAYQDFAISVQWDNATDNSYSGYAISQPLTWTYNA